MSIPPDEDAVVTWRVDQNPSEKGPEKLLEIPPGTHVVTFTAIRKLQARIYSQQRFVPDQIVELNGLSISTNRVFELDGSETTGIGQNDPPNAFTEHVFPKDQASDQRLPLSAVDNWTLELPFDDNPFLRSVTSNDNVEMELDDIADAVLMLEYETGIS